MGNNVQTEGKTPPIPTPPSPPTKPVGDVRINLGLTPTNLTQWTTHLKRKS